MERQANLRKLGFRPYSSSCKDTLYLTHEEYLMALASLVALRSPDPHPNNQDGAVIINQDRRIVSVGYNNFPEVYDKARKINKDFELPLDDTSESGRLGTKHSYMIEAATNAILNRNSTNLKGCTMYTTTLPLNECFKFIVQAGITKVCYTSEEKDDCSESKKGSKVMSIICGVELQKFENNDIMRIELQNHQEATDTGKRKRRTCKIPKQLQKLGFSPDPNGVKPRDVLSTEDFFMAVAFLNRRRSKDPAFKVGACIVDDNGKIVSCGYNGFPNGGKDDLPWTKEGEKTVNNKHMYVCHAELNALTNNYDTSVAQCTIYVTLFPCEKCAQKIVQSQIKKVFYSSDEKADKDEFKASKVLFEKYGVEYVQHSVKEIFFF